MSLRWEIILEEIIEDKGIIILLGASDTGKSYTAKYLIKELLLRNIKVSLIDSDVGQSNLGLPGTVSKKSFYSSNDMESYYFEKFSFIGIVKPSNSINSIVDKTKKMVDLCINETEIIIIDTSGFVSGEIGKKLKTQKIKAIMPKYILAIEEDNELEPILRELENIRIYRIAVSPDVKVISRQDRISNRYKKFYRYFRSGNIEKYNLRRDKVIFLYLNNQIDMGDKYILAGSVIGLNDGDLTIALGIVIESDNDCIIFKSPINTLEKVNAVVLGNIKIDIPFHM